VIYFYRVSVRKIHLPACPLPKLIDKYLFAGDSFGQNACSGEREKLNRVSRDRTYTKALGNSFRIHFAKLANRYVDGWQSPALVSDERYDERCTRSSGIVIVSFIANAYAISEIESRWTISLRSNARFFRSAFASQFSKLILNFELLKSRKRAGKFATFDKGSCLIGYHRLHLNDSFAERLQTKICFSCNSFIYLKASC